ncbi:MAG: hypothetical protein Q9201_001270 [Fulgogasparrea decipioides]
MEIIGGVSGTLTIVGSAAKLAKKLNEIRESYNAVALNIQLAAIQLSTIRAALEDIAEWRLNAPADTRASRNLDATLADSLKGCAVLITVIDGKLGEAGYTPGVKQKMRHLWLEDVLQSYMSNLDGQVRALQLLLTSFQCRTVAEQMQRLERAEARSVFEQVRADTASLTIGNKDLEDAASVLSYDPSVNFEVDDILLKHPAYIAAYGTRRPPLPRRPSQNRRSSISSSPQKAEAKVADQPNDGSTTPAKAASNTTEDKIEPTASITLDQSPRDGQDVQRGLGKPEIGLDTQLPVDVTTSRVDIAPNTQKSGELVEKDSSLSSAAKIFKDQLQTAFEEPVAQPENEPPGVQVCSSHSDSEWSEIDEMFTSLPLPSHFNISKKPENRNKPPHRLPIGSRDQEGRTITPEDTHSVSSVNREQSSPRPASGADPVHDKPNVTARSPRLTAGVDNTIAVDEPRQQVASNLRDPSNPESNHSSSIRLAGLRSLKRQPSTQSHHSASSNTERRSIAERSLKRKASTDSDLYASSITGKQPPNPAMHEESRSKETLILPNHEPSLTANLDGSVTADSSLSYQPEAATQDLNHLESSKQSVPDSNYGRRHPPIVPQTAPTSHIHSQTSAKPIDSPSDIVGRNQRPRSATVQEHNGQDLLNQQSSNNDLRSEEGGKPTNSEQHGLRIVLTSEVDTPPKSNNGIAKVLPPLPPPPPTRPPPTVPTSSANQLSTLSPTTSLDLGRRWSNESAGNRYLTGGLTSSPSDRDESINETLSTASSSDRSDRQTLSTPMTSTSNTVATSLSHPPDSLRGQAQNDLHKLQLELTAAKNRGDTAAQKASLQQSMDVIRKVYLSTSAAQNQEAAVKAGSPPKTKNGRMSLMPKKSMSLLTIVGRKSKQTDLHEAARTGDLDALRSLLEDKVNVNARGDRFSTPQMEAARRGHLHCLETLKEFGADEFAVDGTGRNVLHVAVISNQPKVVSWLIEAYPPAAQDVPGRKSSRLAWATEAITGSRSSKILREAADGEGSRPLHLAAKLGLPGMVSLLLDHGADIEASDNWSRSSLIVAAMVNRLNIVDMLLRRGADIKAKDVQGMTALHWAARNNHYDVMIRLFTKGEARYGTQDWVNECFNRDGDLAIHAAARMGHIEPVSTLKGDRQVSKLHTKHGESLLHIAVLANHLELAKELLHDNADVNAWAKPHSYHLRLWPDNGSRYSPKSLPLPYSIIPLHYSCTAGYYEMTEMLLENGAWVNAAPDDDNHGKSPLMMAVESGSTNLVCLLLARGAKVTAAVPATLETSLHIACRQGDLETAQELVRYGAKTAARTRDLRPPEELIPKVKDPKKRSAMEKYFAELTRQRYAKIKAQMAENRQSTSPGLEPIPTPISGDSTLQPRPSPATGQSQIQVVHHYHHPQTSAGSMFAPEYMDPENDAFPEAPPAYTPGTNAPRNLVNRPGVHRPQYG